MDTIILGKHPTLYDKFADSLRGRGYRSYEEYLHSEEWTAFNQWYRKTSLPQQCLVCGSKQFILHHWAYERAGCEYPCDVIPLCETHHTTLHKYTHKTKVPVGSVEKILYECFKFENNQITARFRPFLMMRENIRNDRSFCRQCQGILPKKCLSKICKNCKIAKFNTEQKFPRFWGKTNYIISFLSPYVEEPNRIFPFWIKKINGLNTIFINIRVNTSKQLQDNLKKLYNGNVENIKFKTIKKIPYNGIVFSKQFPRETWMYWEPDGTQFNKNERLIHD